MAEILSVGTKLIIDPLVAQEIEKEKKEQKEREEFENKYKGKYSQITDVDIQELIKGLTMVGEAQIFKIIRNNDEIYSKNGNGIFFNLSKVKKETRNQIIDFLIYCKNYEFKLQKEENSRAEYKKFLPDDDE